MSDEQLYAELHPIPLDVLEDYTNRLWNHPDPEIRRRLDQLQRVFFDEAVRLHEREIEAKYKLAMVEKVSRWFQSRLPTKGKSVAFFELKPSPKQTEFLRKNYPKDSKGRKKQIRRLAWLKNRARREKQQ